MNVRDFYWNRFLGRTRKIEGPDLTSDSDDAIIGPAKVIDNVNRKVDYARKVRDRKHRKEVKRQHRIQRSKKK